MNAIFYDITGAEIGRASFQLGEQFKIPMGTLKVAVFIATDPGSVLTTTD